MILAIIHHDSEGCKYGCVSVFSDYENFRFAGVVLDCYTRMYDRPNHPVPAIRYHVDSGRTGVVIWNNSTIYDGKSDYFNEHPVFEYP